MLKIVPVWGGGSDFTVEGSTWGRAGRRFRRISLVFFCGGSRDDDVGKARAFEVEGDGEAERLREGGLGGAAMSLVGRGTSGIWETSAMTL